MGYEKTKHGMHYLHVNGARYQIAEEADGGLMVRLVEAERRLCNMTMRASAGNTFHLRPEEN